MNRITLLVTALGLTLSMSNAHALTDISQTPIFVSAAVPPLNMLVMGRDHKLYYEAYNDASDLNGDGVIDVGYKGYLSAEQGGFDYYGYFNSYVCYTHDGTKFVPSTATTNKQCSSKWSGDYLNYLTTSRMDALRKVLYGGYRSTDTTSSTVLQGSYIPQDAHTWGKEYLSVAHDGYRISNYTPLSQPATGYRHLFAAVSLTQDTGVPQLRTLTNTRFRIWNWVSKERPVAGSECLGASGNTSCTNGGPSNDWTLVPASIFTGLNITTWKNSASTATGNQAQMDTLFGATHSNSTKVCGSGSYPSIQSTRDNDTNNPFVPGSNSCTQDNYHTRVTGTFVPTITGNYQFAVDGDDSVDFAIGEAGSVTVRASRYGDNGKNNSANGSTGNVYLTAGTTYTVRLRHREKGGGDNWFVYWKTPETGATSTLTNLNNQVEVCPANNAALREGNCTAYSGGNYKPTGILHDYGASNKMYFGLLSGSFEKNMSGGVLRSKIQSFQKEFNSTTGQFCASNASYCTNDDAVTNGIVGSINKFRIIDFGYGDKEYSCGRLTTGPMTLENSRNNCSMWGNPVAEMMYETLRYFAGATTPTSDYDYGSGTSTKDHRLELPRVATWAPPYQSESNANGYPSCSIPAMTVISDINPSYDYKLPGSQWHSMTADSLLSGFNASTEVDAIWAAEGGGTKSIFIGESAGTADSAPTAKSVANLSTARGLAPEEPSKQGTYYSAGVARFGAQNPIGGDKKLITYSIALASPLPTIKFPVGSSTITVVPFAKSVGQDTTDWSARNFQPTNQIVDYYVQKIANTDVSCSTGTPSTVKDCDATVNGGRPYAEFRINYEDVEQGADHDMDAIALYTLSVNASNQLTIEIVSEYAAGGIDQQMGYVISGTTKDGIYLEVKDQSGANRAYKLVTPEGRDPNYCNVSSMPADCTLSRLTATRTFTPSGTSSATFLQNPLWYAAKYGNTAENPDANNDGVPDNYFLVTNALTLKDQLDKAFSDLSQRNASISRPAVGREPEGDSVTDTNQFIYRTEFDVDTWSGALIKEKVGANGARELAWSASVPASRQVKMATTDGDGLQAFSWANLAERTFDGVSLQDALNKNKDGIDAVVDSYGEGRVQFINGETCSAAGCDTFRTRSSLLGDIIGSNPVLAQGAQYLNYVADSIDGNAGDYATFKAAQKARRGQIYVGANDGMLHAFRADTGAETFAFVPTAVIPKLNRLSASDYANPASENHQYYVDGSLVMNDVYYGGAWHTVLVGTLGAGGREVFALDVTDPDNVQLLWEFTTDSLASKNCVDGECEPSDLGLSIPTPVIARLHDGNWAVVFGNGYNSPNQASGRAVLFMLDIQTGALIAKLDAQGDTVTNGLSSPRLADNNSDGVADYAYAGDLQGNLWRFDLYNTGLTTVTDSDRLKKVASPEADAASQFRVSFGGAPLYTAETADTGGEPQSITAAPSLIRHPSRKGYVVAFGTGRYLGTSDKVDPYKRETLYGIWDQNTKGENADSTQALNRSKLQQQSITNEYLNETFISTNAAGETLTSGTWDARLISQNAIPWYNAGTNTGKHGWYLDLAVTTQAGQQLVGERIVDEMIKRGDVLIFSTRIPSADPCSSGIDGFLYAIDPATGGRTRFNVFDLNKDGKFDARDQKNNSVVSGVRAVAGGFILSTPQPGAQPCIYGPDGKCLNINLGPESVGRQSWRVMPANLPTEEETSPTGDEG